MGLQTGSNLGGGGLIAGAGTALSGDTSLALFTVDSVPVAEPDVINKAFGTASVSVEATPTHAGASRTINGDAAANPVTVNLVTGDNSVIVRVTAQDTTIEDHEVTVHVLTAGLAEITTFNFGDLSGGVSFATAGDGAGFLASNASNRVMFWGQTGTENQPTVPGATSYVEVGFSAVASNADIATAFAASMSSNGWSATPAGAIITATDNAAGVRTDAENSGASIVVAVTQQGSDPA